MINYKLLVMALMEESGYTQKEFSKKLDVSQQAVSKWTKGNWPNVFFRKKLRDFASDLELDISNFKSVD